MNKVFSSHWLDDVFKQREWFGALALFAVAVASVLMGWLPTVAAVLLAGFTLLLVVYRSERLNFPWVKCVVWFFLLPVGLAMALYRPDGFHYPLIFRLAQLHEGGKPFALHLNTAKALAGYMAIVWLVAVPGVLPKRYLSWRWLTVVAVTLAAPVLLVAIPLFGLQWQPKWGMHVVVFLVVNALVTCVAEESFMRLLVQGPIQRAGARFCGPLLSHGGALLVSTLLFAAAHSPQGAEAWGIYLLAGCAYGLGYALSGRLWVAIVTHFTVNAVHYVFLTYPL